jgi:hypothetical protein
MSEQRAEGFWWVRLGSGIRSAVLGDGPCGSWRTLWAYGDSLMTHDPRDGGEFVAMKERVLEWGPYLGTEPLELSSGKAIEMLAGQDAAIAAARSRIEDERYVALAGEDGSLTRFLLRVAAYKFGTDRVSVFILAAEDWNALARETDWGTAPGANLSGETISILTAGGYVPVMAHVSMERGAGQAIGATSRAVLDVTGVV